MAHVLILGAYGLIGSAVTTHLLAAGHSVVGLGRQPPHQPVRTGLSWRTADIAMLRSTADWTPHLADITAIVNCAGALQSGPRDDLKAVQTTAMLHLFAAARAQGIRRFVQISAPHVTVSDATEFSRTKAQADAALVASDLEWVILRPGLVLAPQAYGGTGLLRAAAALPWWQPILPVDAHIRTVAVEDVADAVVRAVDGRLGASVDFDLVEDTSHSFADLVGQMRAWLGSAPASPLLVPGWLAALAFRCGDLAVALGWRTPMCTTALRELQRGVEGDPAPWRTATGTSQRPLAETLARLPSTLQERRYAQTWLLKPVVLLTLAVFWLLSGIIALLDVPTAAAVLTQRGTPLGLSSALVVGGAVIDLLLGGLVLVRRTAGWALAGMLAVSAGYLLGGTLLAPDLWADPLGPLVKILPAMTLALVGLTLLGER